MKTKHLLTCLLLMLVMTGVSYAYDYESNNGTQLAYNPDQDPVQLKYRALFDKLVDLGLIYKFENDYYDAYVDPKLWSTLTRYQKEQISYNILKYCRAKNSMLQQVNIYNYKTMSPLARMGLARGYESFERGTY